MLRSGSQVSPLRRPPVTEQEARRTLDSDAPPLPEVTEGGDSSWLLWYEASRQLDAAFAPTVPSNLARLTSGADDATLSELVHHTSLPWSVGTLMVRARKNNRCCPRSGPWRRLYLMLGGLHSADLPLPPASETAWKSVPDLQKRLRFRDYLEWADSHGQLAEVVDFMDSLSETDWRHMGDA
jgi:hypothetical protein